MDEGAIKAIQFADLPAKIVADNKTYIRSGYGYERVFPDMDPKWRPTIIRFRTLSSFAAHLLAVGSSRIGFVHVASHAHVIAYAHEEEVAQGQALYHHEGGGHSGNRPIVAKAAFEKGEAEPYGETREEGLGQFAEIEQLLLTLRRAFVQDKQLAEVVKFLGNVTGEKLATLQDDGVSQVVTARVGIAKRVDVEVPGEIHLRKNLTFPEILQPSSRWILRLKPSGRDGGLPVAGLFSVSDGLVCLEAVKTIAEHLNRKLDGAIPVYY